MEMIINKKKKIMSTNAIKISTDDMLEIQEAIERDAPISEIRKLLKKARLYHSGEESLRLPVAELMLRILHKYVVYPEEKN